MNNTSYEIDIIHDSIIKFVPIMKFYIAYNTLFLEPRTWSPLHVRSFSRRFKYLRNC